MDDSAKLQEIDKVGEYSIVTDRYSDTFLVCKSPWCPWEIEVMDGVELKELESMALEHHEERHASD